MDQSKFNLLMNILLDVLPSFLESDDDLNCGEIIKLK